MTLTLAMVTCDTDAPLPLARWWADQTGAEVRDPYEGSYLLVSGGSLPVVLAFQLVAEPVAGKNRLHLDLFAADLDGEVDRLLDAGASLVERRGDDSFRWVTLKDPAGNEFCVAAAADAAG